MTYSFNEEWVNKSNADDIKDFFMNDDFYFYMYNIKFISLECQIERLKLRKRYYSIVDLYGLKKIYNMNISFYPINRYIKVRGFISFIDEKKYNNYVFLIQKYLKLWHQLQL